MLEARRKTARHANDDDQNGQNSIVETKLKNIISVTIGNKNVFGYVSQSVVQI